MTPRSRGRWRRGRTLAGVAVILLLIGAVGAFAARRWRDARRARVPSRGVGGTARVSGAVAPLGVRIKVEVLNATRSRGLARRATRDLRDRGFDVVSFGTAPPRLDATVVIDRSGHPAWARLVARALGATRVESRPDSSRYVDVTVLIGASWRSPPGPFYP